MPDHMVTAAFTGEPDAAVLPTEGPDKGEAHLQERLVHVGPPFVADRQPSVAGKPSEGPLHGPTIATQPLVARDAPSCYPRLYAPPSQEPPAARVVVTLVGVQLGGSFPGPSARALDGLHGVDQLLEGLRVMDLGAGAHHRERNAVPLEEQVTLGPGPAAVYRVGTGFLALFLAGTLAESTDALDQSTSPPRPSLSSNARRRRRHTPAFCQSRNRRQQVTPLHPNPLGSIRHGMPLLST